MLDCSEIDMEVSDVGMENTGFGVVATTN